MLKALVVTALEKEFRAVRDHLVQCADVTNPDTGSVYTTAVLKKAPLGCTVCLIQAGPGNAAAASEIEPAITYFRPDIVVFVGIAGALKDVEIGDVVAAESIWNYERGKARDSGFQQRHDGGPCSHSLVQRARAVSRADAWKEGIVPVPTSYMGPIVAGDKLIAGRDSATFRAIKQAFDDALAVEMEGHGLFRAAHVHHKQFISIRGISDFADPKKVEAEAAGSQERAAANAAAFAAEFLIRHSADAPASLLANPPAPLPDTPEHFPPAAARELETVRRLDPDLYTRLIEALTQANRDYRVAIRDLVATPPAWMNTPSVWIVLGYCAAAQDLLSVASSAFEKAALTGAQPPAHWIAQAAANASAASDDARAEQLIAQALGTSVDDVYVRALDATIRGDLEVVSTIDADSQMLTDEERLTLKGLRASALAQRGEQEQAYTELTSLHEAYPDRALITAQLAQVILHRAEALETLDRPGELVRARELALEARDLLRKRRMDSSRSVVLAAWASLLEGDGRSVLDLSLAVPDGEATEEEAASPEVMRLGIEGAILIGADSIAQRLAGQHPDPYWKAVFEATLATRMPDGAEAATRGFERALELAANDLQRFVVLLKVADLGIWPLPMDPGSLEGVDQIQVDLVLARSEVARGHGEDAVKRLRGATATSAAAAEQLAAVYEQLEAGEAAIEVLQAAAGHFQAPELLVRAMDVARRTGLFDRALTIGRDALEAIPPSSRATGYVRHRLIETAARLSDWSTVETYALAQLRLEPASPGLRWALVIALHNRIQLEDAWKALNDGPSLEPQDEYQARIKIHLLSQFDATVHGVEGILEIADRFRESEVLAGSSLMSIYTMQPQFELPPPVLAQLHGQTSDFFERFPESQLLRRVPLEKAGEMLDEVAKQLAQGRDAIDDLFSQIRKGAFPYGLAAGAVNKAYTTVLLSRGVGPLVGVPNAPELVYLDLQAARAALDQTVVIDPSALTVLVGSPDLWDVLRRVFRRILITDLAVVDALTARDDAALRSTLSLTLAPDADELRLVEISAEVADKFAKDADWVAARALEFEQKSVRNLEAFHAEIERFGPWASGIELAVANGFVLYADDLLLRQLTRERGGAAFGTFALGRALLERNSISEAQLSEIDRLLFNQLVVDLPDARQLIEKAGPEHQWGSQAAVAAAGRPAIWADPVASIRFFAGLFVRIQKEAPDLLPSWLYSVIQGGAFLPAIATAPFAAELLLAAILASGSDSARVEVLVEAARAATTRLGAGDPLVPVTGLMLTAASRITDSAQAAQYVLATFAALSESDRVEVMRVVADPVMRT